MLITILKKKMIFFFANFGIETAFISHFRPKEFIECVSHIRQLSWLLLGSLTHCALIQGSTSCMPIPLDAGSHIADHLIVILIGFPEQSKVWQQTNSLS